MMLSSSRLRWGSKLDQTSPPLCAPYVVLLLLHDSYPRPVALETLLPSFKNALAPIDLAIAISIFLKKLLFGILGMSG